MKKTLTLALVLAGAVMLVSCDTAGKEDYFPLGVGSNWCMTGYESFEQVDQPETLFTSVAHTKAVQTTQLTSGEEVVEFSMVETSQVRLPIPREMVYAQTSFVRESGDYILTYSSKDATDPDTTLVLPLETGKTWTVCARGDSSITIEVLGRDDVTVAAGNYSNCWKLAVTSTVGANSLTFHWWLADGVGVVKRYLDVTGQGVRTVMSYELQSEDVR